MCMTFRSPVKAPTTGRSDDPRPVLLPRLRRLTGIRRRACRKGADRSGRASHYAGCGDRAAVRDIVYDALRCKRSFAALGGGLTGRGLVLGAARAAGVRRRGSTAPPMVRRRSVTSRDLLAAGLEALELPDWLAPRLLAALGPDFAPVMQALRQRAPVFLRVNTARTDVAGAIAALAAEGVVAQPHPLAKTALEDHGKRQKNPEFSGVFAGPCRIAGCRFSGGGRRGAADRWPACA